MRANNFDFNKYRLTGNWFVHRFNFFVYKKLKPKLKIYGPLSKYDLDFTFLKIFYWATSKDLVGLYAKRQEKRKQLLNVNVSYIKVALKSLFHFFVYLSNQLSKKCPKQNISAKYLFRLESDAQIEVLQELINKLDPAHTAIISSASHKISPEQRKTLSAKGIVFETINISSKNVKSYFGFRKLTYNKAELWLYNIMLNHLSRLESYRTFYENILAHQKVIFLAGENLFEANLANAIAKEKGYKVFNSMNGIKARTPNNMLVDFYKWFVWDEHMKELLHTQCFISEDMLHITGHPLEERIKSHRYTSSSSILNQIRDKKTIISLFGSPDFRQDKLDLLETIFNEFGNKEEYYILYRYHPSEKKKVETYFDYTTYKNCYFFGHDELKRDLLYDMLMVSNIAIVLGSTVALEAKWLQCPCITFEQKDKSILYCVDGVYIYHVSEPESLKQKTVEVLNNTQQSKQPSTERKNVLGETLLIIENG